METIKQLCDNCKETFELPDAKLNSSMHCPRCGSGEIRENNACSLEVEAPPWEFVCQQCGSVFRVKSPRGPDEVKQMRCPVCESKNVKWMALTTGACATGG